MKAVVPPCGRIYFAVPGGKVLVRYVWTSERFVFDNSRLREIIEAHIVGDKASVAMESSRRETDIVV